MLKCKMFFFFPSRCRANQKPNSFLRQPKQWQLLLQSSLQALRLEASQCRYYLSTWWELSMVYRSKHFRVCLKWECLPMQWKLWPRSSVWLPLTFSKQKKSLTASSIFKKPNPSLKYSMMLVIQAPILLLV